MGGRAVVASVEQLVGLVLVAVGGWLLWSPWALVIGGVVALLLPEVIAVKRR